MTTRLYLDETKAKGYVVVAAAFTATRGPREEIRQLVMPGQRALHMKTEGDARRRLLIATIASMVDSGLELRIYDAGRHRAEKESRARCLEAVVADLTGDTELVIDLDQSMAQWDRQRLIELSRQVDHRLAYRHATRSNDLLLAVPDAIAWSYARGKAWRRRISPLVASVSKV